ncbi:MAG: hypothetical protein JWO38_916 [Gemmataceae bacterium]|nr:hypothetical protein [Gemmataceae bacterium]
MANSVGGDARGLRSIIVTEGLLSVIHTAKPKLATALVVSAGLLGLAGFGTALPWLRTGSAGVGVSKAVLPLTTAAAEPPERPIEGDWLPK